MSLATTLAPDSGAVPIPTAHRKRGARVCDACRAQRSRCSGETPSCARCQGLGIPCCYTLSIRQYRAEQRHRKRPGLTENDAVARSVHSIEVSSSLGCSQQIIRQHTDAYFEFIHPVPVYGFLHRADFLAQYSSGTVSTALLLAVCSVTSRFLSTAYQSAGQVRSWVELAETMVFQSLGKTSLASIQTLIILAMYRGHNN
ncbi:hypothetical protein BU23DRAFT_648089 [Bimuria novae-zelandiae CBS 107.79]|uniref:Zn(2)-C6 fungal-type domain-containing protein n=1 Tax=Bimuria novae-zelandiae CBS 107.79 TaxID=1447943 RepID=A0A6A5V823_9PLEO|nr:hypothetical protein BU23DRAFT_648089 [Bimuria novae-zelandiae CBS 107.79]